MKYSKPTSKDRHKYNCQKSGVKRRKAKDGSAIPFNLTFDEWWNWWQATGHYHERGNGKDKYCMGRYGDSGPYELGNIYCITNSQNAREGTLGIKHTAEHKANISKAHKGRKTEKVTCPHCDLEGGIHNMMRYHFDKCKRKTH